MRVKYLAKIILMSCNEEKAMLLKESEAYMKKKQKSFKILTDDDVRVDEDLLKRFNETVVKTTDA